MKERRGNYMVKSKFVLVKANFIRSVPKLAYYSTSV